MKFCASSGCPISRVPTTAPIGAGDDLEEMTVRIFEIDAPAAIVVIDLALFRLRGVGPIPQTPPMNPRENPVELLFTVAPKCRRRPGLFSIRSDAQIALLARPSPAARRQSGARRDTRHGRSR
jgi:hypothetical protein